MVASPVKIAVLDDYQSVALQMADWSPLQGRATVTVFTDHISDADLLTIHLVLSRRTRGLVGRDELALMKPTALLVNTSRGPIIDEAALIEALRERRVAGAALDIFNEEPLPTDRPYRSLAQLRGFAWSAMVKWLM